MTDERTNGTATQQSNLKQHASNPWWWILAAVLVLAYCQYRWNFLHLGGDVSASSAKPAAAATSDADLAKQLAEEKAARLAAELKAKEAELSRLQAQNGTAGNGPNGSFNQSMSHSNALQYNLESGVYTRGTITPGAVPYVVIGGGPRAIVPHRFGDGKPVPSPVPRDGDIKVIPEG